MPNPFIMKLGYGAELSDEDREQVMAAITRTRKVGARQDLIREGDHPDDVHLVLEGFAYRYKILPDGGRQIMAILLPGDFCDLHLAILGEMDHSIATLTPCTVVDIPRQAVDELTINNPRITRALWWVTLVDEGVLRESLVNMGRRPANRRIAHLFCELLVRLRAVGLVRGNTYDFPFTQEELGDTLALSTVHVNRMLQELRDDGLVVLRGKELTVLDVDRLNEFAEFNPNYLHLTSAKGARAARPQASRPGTPK